MKHGLSDNYILKAHIEEIFGREQFLRVKDYPTVGTWTKTMSLLLSSYSKAIAESINVSVDAFSEEIEHYFEDAQTQLKTESRNEEELFSRFIALQSNLLFLLLGGIDPIRHPQKRNLKSGWNLSKTRTTQIVQTRAQRDVYYEKIVYKTFSSAEIEAMIVERRENNIEDDLFRWIYTEKIVKKTTA